MSAVKLYGLKKCSTCMKARAWLDQHRIECSFTDYREHPVSSDLLSAWSARLGGWEKLVNRASITWRNLAVERKSPDSDTQWLALIAEYPALIRRPVLEGRNDMLNVGFSDKKYTDLFCSVR